VVLRSRRIVTPAGVVDGEVVVGDGRIVSVSPGPGSGATPGSVAASGGVVELGDRWLAPGFIDTHVHGGAGAQFNTVDVDEVAAAARFHAGHGTTALLATLLPAPVDELVASLGAIGSAAGTPAAPTILGAHLEAPFLSPARPGALDPAAFLAPDPAVLDRLLAAAPDTVRMMTLAPELPGALELIAPLRTAGAVASLGHSDASFAQATAALDAGATSVTHLFNAMRPFHHRDPGLLGAALDAPTCSAELIADGIHVGPVALRLAFRARGAAGIRLITDAIAAAGMPDGDYRLGARKVTVVAGEARLGSEPGAALAGSTLTMDAAVAGAVHQLGLGVPEAVALASAVPARVLGIADRTGAIAPGQDADIVVLDDDLRARGTIAAGDWIFGLQE
jgi:N-acetylglucosamine-6-phosphate deacetylase